MRNGNERQAAAMHRRPTERTGETGRGADGDRFPRGRLLAALITAAVAMPFWLLAPVGDAQAQRLLQVSGARRTVSLTVAVGKTEDVRIDSSYTDVTVGDPEIADVTPLTDHALSILGKKIGTTRVTIYAEGKRQVGIFDVEVSYDVSRLSVEISRATSSQIVVSSVNGRIMLSGSVADAVTLDKAMVIARQFVPDGNVINTVHVLQPQQVMLEVRFIEASREIGRDLGVQWNVFGSHVAGSIGARQPANKLPITTPTSSTNIPVGEVAAGVLSGGSPFGFLLGRIIAGGTTIDAALNALEQRGLVRSLAEPNLVALSGDTASFLAGGEFPIPVSTNLGQVTIDYKRYGVGLAFTPTVLKDGVINLKIEPEVSQLDPNNSVPVGNGISVPALIVRRANTTIELRDGQSFMMGGLLLNVSTANQEQLPWVGDVPVLGTLFRSASYQKKETDLAIIVTPRVVRPSPPSSPLKTPLDNTIPANDPDFFLMGKSELTPTDMRLALGQRKRFVGHVLDLPKGAANVVVSKD